MPSLRFLKRFQVDSAKIPLSWLLVIPFVLLIAGETALVGYLSYRSGQQTVENLANQLLQQTSERVSDRLTSHFQPSLRVVAANQFAVQQGILDLNNREQIRQRLWEQIRLEASLSSTGFWLADGTAIAYERVTAMPEQQAIQQQTGQALTIDTLQFLSGQPNLRYQYRVDAQGKPQFLVSTLQSDFRQLDWYRQATAASSQASSSRAAGLQNAAQPFWTSVFVGQVMPGLQIAAVAPVYSGSDRVEGMFISRYVLSDFSRFLNQLHFSPQGQVFIIERSGDLVATSFQPEALAVRQTGGKIDRLPATQSQDERTRHIAQQLLQQFGTFQAIRSRQQLHLTIKGEPQFVQVTPYQSGSSLDWLMITVVPESDFTAEIQTQNRWTLLLSGMTLLGTIALGLLITRRITKPLDRLNAAACKIAQNELNYEIPLGGLGPVKQLSLSFQQMAAQLRQSLQLRTHYERELERQVIERTAELVQVKDLREVIFNESTDAIFLVEPPPTRLIRDCNQRAVELFEVECKADLIGIQGAALQKQPFTEAELAEIAAELAEKGFWSLELEYITRKGKSFWGNLAAKPIWVAGQAMQLVRLTDISDRKQTEERLRRTEQWLQQFSRQVPTSIYTLVQEPDGHLWLEYTSAAVEAIHEITPEQAMQNVHLFLDQMHPDDRAGYAAAAGRSAATLSVFCHEWRITTPSGKCKWLQANSQPERRSNGAVAWHGVIQDITDRKQTEESLRESEERFRQAFDNAAIGMALVAINGQFLQVNRALCEMLGYGEAELLRLTFQEITDPTDLDANLELRRQVLAGERRTYQMKKRYIHKRGRVVWVSLCVSVVRDSQQQPLYFVSQMQDISDRHKLDEMKDEFISIVSHELRTPLTSIRGSLGILDMGILKDEPETAERMLKVAIRNAERLVRLVNDILDLERLESGKMLLVKEPCQVYELMEQAIEAVQTIAQQAEIGLHWTSLPVTVRVAPDAIVQTLTNLLSNAIKFSPAGSTVSLKAEWVAEREGEVGGIGEWGDGEMGRRGAGGMGRRCGEAVEQRRTEAEQAAQEALSPSIPSPSHLLTPSPSHLLTPSPHIRFAITDQGRGIPPEKLESIFGRFQQVDASDARQRGGTGLGLAICRSIVQQHRGRIWAESVVGQGSTFYFTLPVMKWQIEGQGEQQAD